MENHSLSVREIMSDEIPHIADYWLNSDPGFMKSMGVDLDKLPPRDHWINMLSQQIQQAYPEKQSYCIIWLMDGKAVGHCNVNKIIFGKEAYMHLHMWNDAFQQKGLGTSFVKMSLPYFFNNLQLKKLYCEPYALNPAPNKTLEKSGFKFEKEYITTPGFLNFEQPVKRWILSLNFFNQFNR